MDSADKFACIFSLMAIMHWQRLPPRGRVAWCIFLNLKMLVLGALSSIENSTRKCFSHGSPEPARHGCCDPPPLRRLVGFARQSTKFSRTSPVNVATDIDVADGFFFTAGYSIPWARLRQYIIPGHAEAWGTKSGTKSEPIMEQECRTPRQRKCGYACAGDEKSNRYLGSHWGCLT
jgi:hypothetical protein